MKKANGAIIIVGVDLSSEVLMERYGHLCIKNVNAEGD